MGTSTRTEGAVEIVISIGSGASQTIGLTRQLSLSMTTALKPLRFKAFQSTCEIPSDTDRSAKVVHSSISNGAQLTGSV